MITTEHPDYLLVNRTYHTVNRIWNRLAVVRKRYGVEVTEQWVRDEISGLVDLGLKEGCVLYYNIKNGELLFYCIINPILGCGYFFQCSDIAMVYSAMAFTEIRDRYDFLKYNFNIYTININ